MSIQNLFLGFGGTGAHILTYVKELAVQKHGYRPDHLEFLEFDTIARDNWKPGETVKIAGDAGSEETIARGEEVSLDPQTEYFHLADSTPKFEELCKRILSDPARRSEFPELSDWLHSEWLRQIVPAAALNLTRGAAQQRQIGRYAIFANAPGIVNDLAGRLRRMQQRAGRDNINVWIVGSAAGGTGAGCLIDAGYLVHFAGLQTGITPILTGVVVLPEVYADVFADPVTMKAGASLARSYAFLRELDRVQTSLDTYSSDGSNVATEVRYGHGGSMHAHVQSTLFSYRVYLSERCDGEADRTRFFSSVANALDAFTDRNVGAKLLQDQNNDTGAPIGFGATRLVLPKTTFIERFAWEQVQRFLEAITAPARIEGVPSGVLYGSDDDRKKSSLDALKSMLPLFKDLLDRGANARQEDLENYGRTSLSPRYIVENLLQMASVTANDFGVNPTDLEFLPTQLYCNPFESLELGADQAVAMKDIRIKTFEENQKSKGLKEDQKSSADRFARELLGARDEYWSESAGQGTFQRAFAFIKSLNEKRVNRAVDNWVVSTLSARRRDMGGDPANPAEGTPLTRLYREISLLRTAGALDEVARIVEMLRGAVQKQKTSERRTQNSNDAIESLQQAKPPRLSFGTWVEPLQKSARELMQSHTEILQKERLLDELKQLTEIARERLALWEKLISDNVVDNLVRGRPAEKRDSALVQVRKQINSLNNRLDRMSLNGSILISLAGTSYDRTMDGYAARLEELGTVENGRALYQDLLSKAQWSVPDPVAGKDAQPFLALKVDDISEMGGDGRKDLHIRIFEYFRKRIEQRLNEIDVLDYVLFAQNLPGGAITPATVIQKLREKLKDRVLLSVSGNSVPLIRLIYRTQGSANPEKVVLGRSLHEELVNQMSAMTVQDAIGNHSDAEAITLYTAVAPDGFSAKIKDVETCGTQYLQSYVKFSGPQALASLTYHAFRAEEEAWFIERHGALQSNEQLNSVAAITPPRIARLLEKPAMMRAFIHCIATEAIYLDSDTFAWTFRPASGPTVALTTVDDDFLRAAVVFVLQQRPRGNMLVPFTVELATDAAIAAARAANKTYPTALKDALVEKKVENLIDEHFLQRRLKEAATDSGKARLKNEAEGLKRIARFYLPFDSSTALSKRAIVV